MISTLKTLIYFSIAVFSATVPQPPQGAFEGAPGSSLSLTQTNDASAQPVVLDSSMVIESVGDVQSANTSFLFPDSNYSNSENKLPFEYPELDLLGASNADLQCKGGSLGVNLSRLSCTSAFDRMSNQNTVLTWGQRSAGNYQVQLPFRASSLDGFCAIDVVHAPGKVSDLATPLQLKQAAAQVINGCVKNGAPNTGGMIRNVGKMTEPESHPAHIRNACFTKYHPHIRLCRTQLKVRARTKWQSDRCCQAVYSPCRLLIVLTTLCQYVQRCNQRNARGYREPCLWKQG